MPGFGGPRIVSIDSVLPGDRHGPPALHGFARGVAGPAAPRSFLIKIPPEESEVSPAGIEESAGLIEDPELERFCS